MVTEDSDEGSGVEGDTVGAAEPSGGGVVELAAVSDEFSFEVGISPEKGSQSLDVVREESNLHAVGRSEEDASLRSGVVGSRGGPSVANSEPSDDVSSPLVLRTFVLEEVGQSVVVVSD